MSNPRVAQIDPARTVMLPENWRAAVCVDDRGEESLWLIAPTVDGPAGCACRACAPHEQVDSTDWKASA